MLLLSFLLQPFQHQVFSEAVSCLHSTHVRQCRSGRDSVVFRSILLNKATLKENWRTQDDMFSEVSVIMRITRMTFLHQSIHPLIHFYLFHLLRLIPPFCLRLLLFFTSPSPPPPHPQLIGADYGPDHNTDRRLAACDPIPPSPDPGLPSHSALAFLGEKRNLDKHSVWDWISACLRVSSQLWDVTLPWVRRGDGSNC